MAREKKKLTPSQEKRRYTIYSWAAYFGQFGALVLPFVAVGLANWNKYFVQYEGWKVSIGFILAMGVLGFTILGITKWKMKDSYVVLLVKYILIMGCAFFLGKVLEDIAAIMAFGLIGLFSAFVLNKTSQHYENESKELGEAKKEYKKKKNIEAYEQEEQAKEEKKVKKIRVRIRK